MQEEVENRAVNLVISTTKLSLRTVVSAGQKYLGHRRNVKQRRRTRRDQKRAEQRQISKINGLPLNRALRDDKGNVADAIAGPFLVVGLQGDGFRSLDADQMFRYEKQFHQPEMFLRMGKGIMALPIPDESIRLKEASKAETARDGGQKAAGSDRIDSADKGRNKTRRQPER